MQNPQKTSLKLSLMLVATMTIMSGVTVVSSLPLMSQTFSHIANIDFLSKLMLSIPSLVIALFAPIVGHMMDKTGRLKPLYLGIILFIIGGSSGFYLNDFYLILVGRAVLGLGVALIMTSSTALIGDYFNADERHKYLSIQGMAVGFGGIIFITSGGFLAELHWSYPFAIYLLPLLFIPFLLWNLYEPRHEEHHNEELELEGNKLLPVFATAFAAMVLFYMLPTQLPYLVISELEGTPSSVGLLISVAMFVNAMTALQYAKLKSKLSYGQIFMITFIVFGIGLSIIARATNISELYFSVLFMGMGFGLILTNINAWFLATVPAKQRAKASGVLASSFFLGQFSSPLVFEPVVQSLGIQGLFLMVSFVSFTVAFIIWMAKREK